MKDLRVTFLIGLRIKRVDLIMRGRKGRECETYRGGKKKDREDYYYISSYIDDGREELESAQQFLLSARITMKKSGASMARGNAIIRDEYMTKTCSLLCSSSPSSAGSQLEFRRPSY